ncbi:MAG TPA: sulfur carrier protein ThiS adenylyltransferase ThiF [Rectinemataceae bacterium]|nr:sulfur carrier protein ThiS adenylyltransferase ThiF [Rectinemataceae bacterium]
MERDKLRAIFSLAKVGIAGAGGLGSNCAVALVRAGVRRLVIADFDSVSAANLDRQYYFRDQVGEYKVDALAANLGKIEPGLEIAAHRVRLDPESLRLLYQGCDVIVEAFDSADAKAMLIETCLDAFPETQVVAASGLAGIGHFETIRIVHRGKLHLCGDFENEVSPDSPPIAPRVAIVANLEADIVLELLLRSASGT